MNPWAKATLQGAACGLMLGMVALIGGRVWQPQVAVAQGRQPAVTDLVRTKRVELVDEVGKVRAVLAMTKDGPLGLHLHDAAGKVRASLDLLGDDPALGLCNAAGTALVNLTTSRLVFADAAGMTTTDLGLSPDGTPSLKLADAAGKPRTSLIVHFNGSPTLGLFDAAGKIIWLAP